MKRTFRVFINDTDHGSFEDVTSAMAYIQGLIEEDELETVDATELSIQIVK